MATLLSGLFGQNCHINSYYADRADTMALLEFLLDYVLLVDVNASI